MKNPFNHTGHLIVSNLGLPPTPSLDIDLSLPADVVKKLPPKAQAAHKMYEIARRSEAIKREEAEKERISNLVGQEGLFRFGYVPFVIAKLAWDYADTVILCSGMMGLTETRRLSRAIRQLKRQYDNGHHYYTEDKYQDHEEENMYVYEDAVKNIFRQYTVNLKCDLARQYPNLNYEYMELIVSVYQCHVTIESLLLYAARQEERMAKIVGHPVGHLIPQPVRALSKLIMEYVGDKPASKEFEKLEQTYIKTFATQIGLIELTPIK